MIDIYPCQGTMRIADLLPDRQTDILLTETRSCAHDSFNHWHHIQTLVESR